MAHSLPRLVVLGAGGPAPRVAEAPSPQVLSKEEVDLLTSRVSGENVAEHCEPLQRHRWAVGRKMTSTSNGGVFVWRVVSTDAHQEMGGHPAWLWTEDGWFDPGVSAQVDVGLPIALPLRQLLLHAGSALGRGAQPATLAAVVEAVRTSTRPIALKVSDAALVGHDNRARWALLSLLTVLPTAVAHAMRVRVGPPPSPSTIDLTVVSQDESGYTVVDIHRPPKRVHDVAAYFVHERLTDDDPESVEAASALYGRDDEDWTLSIAGLIRDGLVGSSKVLDSLGGAVPQEGAGRAARADDELSAATVEDLVREARRSGDPGPWRELRRRPAVQRSTAVRALAAAAETIEPTPELVSELAVVYPRGATLDEWLPALLGWLQRGIATEAVVQAIQTTLLEWPSPVTEPLRLEVWPGVIRDLVRHGKGQQASDALLRSPLSAAIAKEGQGQALVDGWRQLPRSERGTPNQKALAKLLRSAPNGAELFATLKKKSTSTTAPARERSAAPPEPPSAPARGRRTPAPAPPRGADARAQLLALARRNVVTADVEGKMLAAVASAIAKTRFPDADIASVAEQMAGQAETNRAWGWLALASAAPGTWTDDVIDATLYAFCSDPPSDQLGQNVALAAARGLGQARKWDAIGHARWIVQFAIAPESRMNRAIVKALLEGIGKRTDGTPFLTEIVEAVLQLPPDHDAVHWLLELLIPSGWRGERLGRVLRSITADQVPRELASRWNVLVAEARG